MVTRVVGSCSVVLVVALSLCVVPVHAAPTDADIPAHFFDQDPELLELKMEELEMALEMYGGVLPFRGEWSREENTIHQTDPTIGDMRFFFGTEPLLNYVIEVEALKTEGAEGFFIMFGATGIEDYYNLGLGGWGNEWYMVERFIDYRDGWHVVNQRIPGSVETDVWYHVRVEVRGDEGVVNCFLDGEEIFDFEIAYHGRPGYVGFAGWYTSFEYRDYVIKDLDGNVIYVPDFEVPEGLFAF